MIQTTFLSKVTQTSHLQKMWGSDRVKAFGFETLTVEDGDNLDEVLAALEKAKTKGKT